MISLFFRLFFFLLLIPFASVAQHTDFLYQPEIAINYNPANRWSFNFEVNNRNLINDQEKGFASQHLEFSHFTSYESGFYGKVSLGLRYRNRDWFNPEKGNELRITQQYNYNKAYNQYRLGHRIRLEERLYQDEAVFRLRYRLSIDFPLQGLTLNTREFYTALSTESLYSIGKKINPELDHRFTLKLGNKLNESLKLQAGIEYRLEDYLINTQHRIFTYTSAIINL